MERDRSTWSPGRFVGRFRTGEPVVTHIPNGKKSDERCSIPGIESRLGDQVEFQALNKAQLQPLPSPLLCSPRPRAVGFYGGR